LTFLRHIPAGLVLQSPLMGGWFTQRGIRLMAKLCKDCKHRKKGWISPFDGRFDQCSRRLERDLVLGRARPLKYCSIERDTQFVALGACGPQGKYWEPKRG